MHTFFCNTVVHGQYVHYRVKSLPLSQSVTLTHVPSDYICMIQSSTVDTPGHTDQLPVFNSINCPVVIKSIVSQLFPWH